MIGRFISGTIESNKPSARIFHHLPRNGSFTKCTNSTFPCSCRLKRDLNVSHLGCIGNVRLSGSAVRFSPVAGEDWLWQLWQGWQPWQHWQASPASPPFRQRLGQGHQHPMSSSHSQKWSTDINRTTRWYPLLIKRGWLGNPQTSPITQRRFYIMGKSSTNWELPLPSCSVLQRTAIQTSRTLSQGAGNRHRGFRFLFELLTRAGSNCFPGILRGCFWSCHSNSFQGF